MPRVEMEAESFGSTWGYRDLLYGMVVIFMALASLAFVAVATPQKNPENSNGMLQISMGWDWDNRDDVDLWVRAPDSASVGYSNRQVKNCSLLRDDLGDGTDPMFDNREVVICRNAVPGEYIVNVQLFGTHDHKFPVHTHVQVMQQGDSVPLLKGDMDLTEAGDEKTVFRFKLDQGGRLIPGSVNQLFFPVRSGTHS